jgi:hypothetical protein
MELGGRAQVKSLCPLQCLNVLTHAVGGMSGSYSNLTLFPSTSNDIFAWQYCGALDLTLDT